MISRFHFFCFSLFLIFVFSPVYIFAYTPRSFPTIDIISRGSRWANESLRFKKTTTVSTGSDDKGDDTVNNGIKPVISPSNATLRNSYLKLVFPEQYLVDKIVRAELDHDLIWSYGYHYSKSRIMVHHTVTNIDTIKTPDDAKTAIQKIFEYHTLTRDRGDVGYNFIIDNFGNIYEWRAWGEWVIGAHAKYNNTDSIGIALLGNFEVGKPTDVQLAALTKLITALSIKYKIHPDNQIYAHIEDDAWAFPFVNDVVRPAIMGHRDTGKTACPGKNLYSQLDTIRVNVKANIKKMNVFIPITALVPIYRHPEIYIAETDKTTITIPYPLSQKMTKCTLLTKDRMTMQSCHHDGKKLTVSLTKAVNKKSSWLNIIEIKTKSSRYKIIFNLNRASDSEIERQERRAAYEKIFSKIAIPSIASKKHSTIGINTIQTLITKPITVLLYDLSTAMNSRYIRCSNCTVTDSQGNMLSWASFRLKIKDDKIIYNSKTISGAILDSITIQNKTLTGRVYFSDYERTSYGGILRNNFYGTVTISRQLIQKIGQSTPTMQYVVTNTISLDHYMAGIVETNDSEPREKNKVMAIIAKNYILYYLDPTNRHPSIPTWVTYNAVDDARIFQKYAGAGVGDTLTLWTKALKATKGQYVMYTNTLAFLPYFSCSAGFTRSAAEKWWWSDTPYLKSVLDSDYCSKFDGHGVGLAGKGASSMARNGATHDQIIKYYYPGVNIVTM